VALADSLDAHLLDGARRCACCAVRTMPSTCVLCALTCAVASSLWALATLLGFGGWGSALSCFIIAGVTAFIAAAWSTRMQAAERAAKVDALLADHERALAERGAGRLGDISADGDAALRGTALGVTRPLSALGQEERARAAGAAVPWQHSPGATAPAEERSHADLPRAGAEAGEEEDDELAELANIVRAHARTAPSSSTRNRTGAEDPARVLTQVAAELPQGGEEGILITVVSQLRQLRDRRRQGGLAHTGSLVDWEMVDTVIDSDVARRG